MQTKVKKWGNSLALRIPKAFADEMSISLNSPVEISIVEGNLVIAPLPQKEFSLHELLAEISEDNLHHEVETGEPVGNEAW